MKKSDILKKILSVTAVLGLAVSAISYNPPRYTNTYAAGNSSLIDAVIKASDAAIKALSLTENKKYNMTNTNRAVDCIPHYVNTVIRSRDLYNKCIDQFNVAKNKRHLKNGNSTYCNIFVSDVMNAMNISNDYSHWNYKNKPVTSAVGIKTKGALEFGVRRTLAWLKDYGKKYGWKKISAKQAQTRANSGYPTLVVNNSGSHIAVVRPEGNGYKYSDSKGTVIAQAGLYNTNYGNVKTYFGNLNVTYWTHD